MSLEAARVRLLRCPRWRHSARHAPHRTSACHSSHHTSWAQKQEVAAEAACCRIAVLALWIESLTRTRQLLYAIVTLLTRRMVYGGVACARSCVAGLITIGMSIIDWFGWSGRYSEALEATVCLLFVAGSRICSPLSCWLASVAIAMRHSKGTGAQPSWRRSVVRHPICALLCPRL